MQHLLTDFSDLRVYIKFDLVQTKRCTDWLLQLSMLLYSTACSEGFPLNIHWWVRRIHFLVHSQAHTHTIKYLLITSTPPPHPPVAGTTADSPTSKKCFHPSSLASQHRTKFGSSSLAHREETSTGALFKCRGSTWDDGVNADGSMTSQREAEVLLPPVDPNDPDERQEASRTVTQQL